MFDMSIEVKCSITVAIISVLVYLLLINILNRSDSVKKFGASMDDTEWYKSMEVMMLVSVFLAYNINTYLFTSCKSS